MTFVSRQHVTMLTTLALSAALVVPAVATAQDGERKVLEMWTHSAGNPAELAVYDTIIADFNASLSRQPRLHLLTRSRLSHFAGRCRPNEHLTGALSFAAADPVENSAQTVIVVLCPTLERMIVAFGTLQPRAEEDL